MLSEAERFALQNRVKNFFVKNPEISKADAANHFIQEGICKKTAYNYINRELEGQALQVKKKSDNSSTWDKAKLAKLKRLTNNRKGVSQRKLAKKFNVNQSTISRQLAKMKITYRKREKTPKYNEAQRQKAQKNSRKLVNQLYKQQSVIILDDEKYFCFAGNEMPGNAGYYTDNKEKCPEDVRFAGKEKFPKKILMWIAISERGMSKPLFRSSKSTAICSKVYIQECLEKRLLPFIEKYHSDYNYLFWPDLASAHRSAETISWMNEMIYYVPVNMNPPNVPKARPIEDFWGVLAQNVYEGGWEAKSEKELIKRIESCLKKFDLNFLQSLMSGIKTKLRSIADKGVLSIYKK